MGFYCFVPVLTGLNQVLSDSTGFLLGFPGFYSVVKRFFPLCFIMFYWVLLGFTGFYRVLPSVSYIPILIELNIKSIGSGCSRKLWRWPSTLLRSVYLQSGADCLSMESGWCVCVCLFVCLFAVLTGAKRVRPRALVSLLWLAFVAAAAVVVVVVVVVVVDVVVWRAALIVLA